MWSNRDASLNPINIVISVTGLNWYVGPTYVFNIKTKFDTLHRPTVGYDRHDTAQSNPAYTYNAVIVLNTNIALLLVLKCPWKNEQNLLQQHLHTFAVLNNGYAVV